MSNSFARVVDHETIYTIRVGHRVTRIAALSRERVNATLDIPGDVWTKLISVLDINSERAELQRIQSQLRGLQDRVEFLLNGDDDDEDEDDDDGE